MGSCATTATTTTTTTTTTAAAAAAAAMNTTSNITATASTSVASPSAATSPSSSTLASSSASSSSLLSPAAVADRPRYTQPSFGQRIKAALPSPSMQKRKAASSQAQVVALVNNSRGAQTDLAAKAHHQHTSILPQQQLSQPQQRQQQQQQQSPHVIHDKQSCMFKIRLEMPGSIAALCYLPTRLRSLIEFYHTEIPVNYRDKGLGDLLVEQALRWAEENQLLVLATCPFVKRHLYQHGDRACVVQTEQEGVERLQTMVPFA